MKEGQLRKQNSYTSKSFPYDLDFENIDFRKNSELYRIGKGGRVCFWLSRISLKYCRTGDLKLQRLH